MNESGNESELGKRLFEIKQLFYDALFKRFPEIVIILDKDGNIVDISENALEFLGSGIQKEDVIGKSGFQYVAPDYLELARKDYGEAFKKGIPRDNTYKFMINDNSYLYGKLNATLIQDEEGNPQFFVGIIRDITKETEHKSDLVKGKEMFQLVLDNIPQFIFWKNMESIYLGCNRNFARVAGVGDPKKIIGKTDFDLPWEKSQAESFYEIDRLVMESNKPEYHIIEPQLQADGKKAWLDTNKIPLHDSEGHVVGLLGTYEDITERVLAKKALEQSEKRYRHLFDNSPLAICLLDFEGTILDVNETLSKLFPELNRKILIGLNIFEWIAIYNEDKVPFFQEILEDLIKGEINNSFEVDITNSNNEIVWIHIYLSLLKIEEQNLIQVILQDITDRKLAEQQLKESEKKYRESYNRANFYKDIFSHDIGNILQNIGSANDLIDIFLEKPEKSEESKEIISIIKDQVLRGAKLIDNIQKLSQIEESENPLKKMDLSQVLNDSINFIDNWVQKTNLDIHINTYKTNITIQANELLIDVFQNLLINAVKYNDNRIIEITINITEHQKKAKNYLRIDFIDNGIGIEDARKEEIFQRAYNKEKSTTGLGLGLSLVKKIVESYNGQIWIEDRIKGDASKGSDFVIIIPID